MHNKGLILCETHLVHAFWQWPEEKKTEIFKKVFHSFLLLATFWQTVMQCRMFHYSSHYGHGVSFISNWVSFRLFPKPLSWSAYLSVTWLRSSPVTAAAAAWISSGDIISHVIPGNLDQRTQSVSFSSNLAEPQWNPANLEKKQIGMWHIQMNECKWWAVNKSSIAGLQYEVLLQPAAEVDQLSATLPSAWIISSAKVRGSTVCQRGSGWCTEAFTFCPSNLSASSSGT